MDRTPATRRIVDCSTCGLVQRVGRVPLGSALSCAQCGSRITARKPNSRTRTGAFALTALILYVPANVYPIVTTDYWGAHTATTIFDGVRSMLTGGAPFVGLLVLTTSIITPAFKIAGLLFLALTVGWPRWRRARTTMFKIIEIIDPWNMLEVTLLSILVAIAELGRIATVTPGTGVFSFAGMVVMTLLASISFDPRLVWDTDRSHG